MNRDDRRRPGSWPDQGVAAWPTGTNPYTRPNEQGGDGRGKKADAFDQFEASLLYCPKCKEAVPVRKRLLLILPEGDKYEYLCTTCSSELGSKIEQNADPVKIVMT